MLLCTYKRNTAHYSYYSHLFFQFFFCHALFHFISLYFLLQKCAQFISFILLKLKEQYEQRQQRPFFLLLSFDRTLVLFFSSLVVCSAVTFRMLLTNNKATMNERSRTIKAIHPIIPMLYVYMLCCAVVCYGTHCSWCCGIA